MMNLFDIADIAKTAEERADLLERLDLLNGYMAGYVRRLNASAGAPVFRCGDVRWDEKKQNFFARVCWNSEAPATIVKAEENCEFCIEFDSFTRITPPPAKVHTWKEPTEAERKEAARQKRINGKLLSAAKKNIRAAIAAGTI